MIGTILTVSRRAAKLLSDNQIYSAKVASKALDVVVGDKVQFDLRNGEAFITELLPAVNILSRSYNGKTKRIGANIDVLFIITAVGELFNSNVIDRMILLGSVQSIQPILVINKIDLILENEIACKLAVYESLNIKVIRCSGKNSIGLEEIEECLKNPNVRIAGLAGVSGVGKSTILQALIPDANCRVGEVSGRTGQGRQTTTQTVAYIYPDRIKYKLIIDYPGIQYLGVNFLEEREVMAGFPEIEKISKMCQFSNCLHISERVCEVQAAVLRGEISQWRYQSYVKIIGEIQDARRKRYN